jgi:hypothetical protein
VKDAESDDSSFSEEKEAKRLLSIYVRGPIPMARPGPPEQICKSLFASFSSEKDEFLPSVSMT